MLRHCHTHALQQAFQCTEQAVQLFKDGWFLPEEAPSAVSKMRNPKEPGLETPVIVVSEWHSYIYICIYISDCVLCLLCLRAACGLCVGERGCAQFGRCLPAHATQPRSHRRRHAPPPPRHHHHTTTDKDTDEVDNDWFLCPMAISHHQSDLLRTAFPVENRLVTSQVWRCGDVCAH